MQSGLAAKTPPAMATLSALLVVLPALLPAAIAPMAAVDVFVDPLKGSDSGAGSAAHPLQSLRAAQVKALASAAGGGEVTVHLAAGALFNLADPTQGGGSLNFSSAESGAVRWVGEGDAGARVSGAAWMPTWTATAQPSSSSSTQVAAGTSVVATACNATDPTQKGWSYEAASGYITYGQLCLSADRWGLPLNLHSCANTSTHQNFTYGAPAGKQSHPTQHYTTMAPANTATLYPAALEASPLDVHPGIQKAYVYRVASQASQNWLPVNSSAGILRNPDTNQCLAARASWKPAPTIVWAAALPANGQSRHLYINNVRANRTRSKPAWTVAPTVSDAGYDFTDAAWCKTALSWPNPSTVEFLFHSAPCEQRVPCMLLLLLLLLLLLCCCCGCCCSVSRRLSVSGRMATAHNSCCCAVAEPSLGSGRTRTSAEIG